MCYSHFGNEVCNGAISIRQRSFINDRYKVNPVGQWGKILVMAMGLSCNSSSVGMDFLHSFMSGLPQPAVLEWFVNHSNTMAEAIQA
jgi:hypothetical protein